MEHYKHLILKALINQGGSSSETHAYNLLTASFSERSDSVSKSWAYLDGELKHQLIEIFEDVLDVRLSNLSEQEVVSVLIKHLAKKGGSRDFHAATRRDEIDRMSDDEYFDAIAQAVKNKKEMLLSKEG